MQLGTLYQKERRPKETNTKRGMQVAHRHAMGSELGVEDAAAWAH